MRAVILPVTAFQQNCSIVWNEQNRRAAVVDPGGDLDRVLAQLDKESLTLDVKQDPKHITLKPDDENIPAMQGIYKIEEDVMTLALGRQGRPEKFESEAGGMTLLLTLKRKTD